MEPLSRAHERDRAIVRTFLGGATLQVSIAGSTLAALPFVTRHLSAAEFGVFATLTGFAALFSFADLGIGGSLTTRLAHARGRGDTAKAASAVATASLAACVAGLLISALLVSSLALIPWQQVLGAEHVSRGAVSKSVIAAAVAAGASVPAGIGQRILYGLGKGALANVWLVVASLLGAATLVVGSLAHWPLPALVLTALGIPVLAGFASGYSAVVVHAPHLRPNLAKFRWAEWRRLQRSSGWHFAIAVAGAISFQTDAMIVAGVLGASAAGVYAIAVRAFGLIAQTMTPAMLQLWPAFGDAYIRGDYAWIRSRLAMSTLLAGTISTLAGAVAVVVGPEAIRLFLTDQLVPDRSLLVALTVWTTYSLVSAPTFLLLNAIGRVRTHAYAAIAVAVVNLPTSLVMTHFVGISGPAWGSLIASAFCSGPVGVLIARKVFSGWALTSPEGPAIGGPG